jgi:FlaA1/EpsC-like NDP-sugar epimerase
VFSVSTDKAANPSSMMGASKRLMEHALFLPGQPWPDSAAITSARFANVAFSNGSLLQSWQRRIANGQPLACPEDTRRYFVSLVESGHLCTLAGFAGTDRSISVPTLEPDAHLVLMSDVATRFLDFHGYEPYTTHDEEEALSRLAELSASGRWPLLLTPLDTGGEKPYEEFVGANETMRDGPCAALREIDYVPPAELGSVRDLVAALEAMLASRDPSVVTTDALKQLVASVEPAFAGTHRASVKSLDDRM